MMIFEFKKDTIYPTVGYIINTSKECSRTMHPKGVKSRMTYKLYDAYGILCSEHITTTKGWLKLIARDMHKMQSGSVESVCYTHPYRR
ncbi:MAG: hypothetical protein L3J43_02465 [Sulfurovum sp.]|nr:hypothetical protein [Sulfurovum sp.]